MSRGQQGIGISAAGMYGQLTTGSATRILSKIKGRKEAQLIEVQLDTRANKPAILKDELVEWSPVFSVQRPDGQPGKDDPIRPRHLCGHRDGRRVRARASCRSTSFSSSARS